MNSTVGALEAAGEASGWTRGEVAPGFRMWSLVWSLDDVRVDVQFTRNGAINAASWYILGDDGYCVSGKGGYAKGVGKREQVINWFTSLAVSR